MSQPIRRILVAVKDLNHADVVAGKAAQLARGLNAELCLFHAMTDPLYVDMGSLTKQTIAEAESKELAAVKARLEKIALPLRSTTLKACVDAAWDYPSQDAVIRASVRWKADLVVVDCQRHAHTAPWFLHFTDWELLRNCPLPVLLVKHHALYTRAPVLAALDPGRDHDKPAGLDADVLDYGLQMAGALQDHLHVVNAFNPVPALAASQLVIPQVVAEAEQQCYAAAHGALDPLLDRVGIAPKRRHIQEGFPIDVIERVAGATDAQILVMGALSRTGLKGLLIGNTAERMLDRVTCDLMIVKPAGFRNLVGELTRGPQLLRTSALAATGSAAS